GKGGHTPGCESSTTFASTACMPSGSARGACRGDATMTRDKDRKRIIRERMKKTGESYTTARSHIIARHASNRTASDSVEPATLAGMSDDNVAARTGRPWREWVRVLDAHGAASMSHARVAALVHDTYAIGDWWAQTVTVGYERIKGLRERGQRRDGSYE